MILKIRFLFLLTSAIVFFCCKQEVKQEQTNSKLLLELTNTKADAGIYYKRANQYFEQGAFAEAITDLEAAIKIDSLNPNYYHLLSDCNMDYYRSKDALQNMELAVKLFPERIETLLKLSETQLILKQFEPSLMTVAQILSIEPDNAEGHFMKGMNFKAMGETDRAINAFQTVTEIDPENIDAWLIAGDLFSDKGLDIALEYYQGALSADPRNTKALHSKAYYLQNHGNDIEAISIYKQINHIDKNYTDAYLNAGILYMTMDSLGQALEQFNIMASVKPQNHQPYYYRGLIYEAQGKLSAARTEFQNCINLKPDFVKAKKAMNNLSTG